MRKLRKEDLRIVFMGTPEFAVDTLRKLRSNHYNVVGIITQPDKAVGRHQTEKRPSPVKQYANKYYKNVPLLQPEKMKDPKFLKQLKSLKANLQVVVAFRMLPEEVWSMPKYGTFNVHAALLPQYRGAAPINWAIINGEKKTGVTTFFLDKNIDTGRIISFKEYLIYRNFNIETVYKALMERGAKLCLETLNTIVSSNGQPPVISQDDLTNTGMKLHVAPKITNETCEIDWNQPAKRVYDFIRGLAYPGTWTTIIDNNDKQTILKIFLAKETNLPASIPNVISIDGKHLYISTADKQLEIIELQLQGKKRMKAADFINGMKNKLQFIKILRTI